LKLEIEVLSKKHDRSAFDCSDSELNYFLQRIARQHINKGISKTFVLVSQDIPTEIIAYMTLVVCEIFASEVPHSWKKKYPQKIPAAKLARLAVSSANQRMGYGKILLIDAMKKTINVSKAMGIAGLFVDAKHQEARNYYEQFGFIALPDQLENLFLPLPTLKEAVEEVE
jgi:GNAT superfamily N-acetyltransferase